MNRNTMFDNKDIFKNNNDNDEIIAGNNFEKYPPFIKSVDRAINEGLLKDFTGNILCSEIFIGNREQEFGSVARNTV